jgi:type II secretory pathway pseudopilin PulG
LKQSLNPSLRGPLATDNWQLLRTAFTFAEVLFAVMILGIGFIMVAAILPVAIQQSQANLEESAAIAQIKKGIQVMEQAKFTFEELQRGLTPPNSAFPDRSAIQQIYSFAIPVPPNVLNRSLYDRIKGDLVNAGDPRFAWVPIGYKLGTPVTDALGNQRSMSWEVYLVAMTARNRATFTDADVTGYTFYPKQCSFYLTPRGAEPSWLTFTVLNTQAPAEHAAAAEGAYVFVQDDHATGAANGRFYRLGAQVDNQTATWELLPGKDPVAIAPGLDGIWGTSDDIDVVGRNSPLAAKGCLIGRGRIDLSNRAYSNNVEGPAQDLFAVRATIFFPGN